MLCVGQGSKTYIFFLCKTSMKKKEIFFYFKIYRVYALSCYTQ